MPITATPRRRWSSTVNWSQRWRKSVSTVSSTGQVSHRNPFAIVWTMRDSRSATSITLRFRSTHVQTSAVDSLSSLPIVRVRERFLIDMKRQGKTLGLEDQLAQGIGVERQRIRAKFHRVEHHSSHVAAGFLISPFDEAAILSVDGMGDFTSTLTAHGRGSSWQEFDRVYFPHSIGFLYSTITMYLGFPYYGDEYKVMGLAPYGEPEFADVIRKMIRPVGDTFELNLDYFTHHKRGVRMKWNDGAPIIQPFHSQKLIDELGPMRRKDDDMTSRHDNIAKSLQVVTEEIILHLLNRLHEKTKSDNVCLTGGVAMNSVANGKITSQTPFKQVYIPAGAADNGTSFGAAFYVWNKLLGHPRTFVQDHAYLGCESDDEECCHCHPQCWSPVFPM